jgi:serine/threonine protein kinase
MDFGSHGKMAQAKAQAQAQTQVQADRGQVAPLDQEVLKAFTPYKIVREIARGGMGIIYEAQHPKFGKVALKLLPESEEIEDVDVQRFVREGEALRKVISPQYYSFL